MSKFKCKCGEFSVARTTIKVINNELVYPEAYCEKCKTQGVPVRESAYTQEKSRWQVPENADFAWHLDKVAKSVTDLLKEKNAAYGNSALNPANIFSKLDAIESLLVRMDDKVMRIKNRGINDETEDTVTDLIGYLFLLKMAMERKK